MFAYSIDNEIFSVYKFKTKYAAIMQAIKKEGLKSGVSVYIKESDKEVQQFLTTANQIKTVENKNC